MTYTINLVDSMTHALVRSQDNEICYVRPNIANIVNYLLKRKKMDDYHKTNIIY